MASLQGVKAAIAELAGRPNAVRFTEIERIVQQLGELGYSVGGRPACHGRLFRVDRHTFQVSGHTKGSGHVRRCYVREFLDVMLELGLLED